MNSGQRQRKRMRLDGYDYRDNGDYYVTTCTARRQPLFSDPRCTAVVKTHWQALPRHYPQVRLGAFVVMPDHVHGIITIDNDPVVTEADANRSRGAIQHQPNAVEASGAISQASKPNARHGLPEILRWFKSHSARRINFLLRAAGNPVWQRSYYDHIIRGERSRARIQDYITMNPACWNDGESLGSDPKSEEMFWAALLETSLALPDE